MDDSPPYLDKSSSTELIHLLCPIPRAKSTSMSSDPASSVPFSNANGAAMMTTCGRSFSSTQRPISSGSNTPTDEDLMLDFSMTDLNDIHHHLWLVGSYGNVNTLHHQRVLLRNIIPSEMPRLHLVWFDRTIYIKPLPDRLLSFSIFPDKGSDPLGLVIRFPVDLAIAKKSNLISKDVTWEQWATLRRIILIETEDSYSNKRYEYGELRLNRLDIIYRLTGRGLTYFTVHRNYKTYFAQYISLFATIFAFVAIILTAMQVLVAIPDIPVTLTTTSYRFCVAVLVGVCVCFGYMFLVFLFMFLYNLFLALVAHPRQEASQSYAS